MPHAALKLIPGVDQNRTLALNEAALSYSNLIRFVPDRQGIGLPQKLGGWTRFFNGSVASVVRALWAWEDTNGRSWLGVGAEQSLSVIYQGALNTITPQTTTADIPLSFATTAGDSTVTMNATDSALDNYDVVDIRTQVSVGGLILFGKYPIIAVNDDQFQINAVNLFGNLEYAYFSTATKSVTGASWSLGTATLTYGASYTFATGDVISVTGVSPSGYNGLYVVTGSTATTVSYAVVSNPGAYVSGGSIANKGAVPIFDATIDSASVKVTLYNHNLLAGDTFPVLVPTTVGGITFSGNYTVLSSPPATTNTFYITAANSASSTATRTENSSSVTGASGTGATATLTYSGSIVYPIGSSINVSGVGPSGYNGTYTVTGSGTGTVSYANATSSAYVSGGVVNTNFVRMVYYNGIGPVAANAGYGVGGYGGSTSMATAATSGTGSVATVTFVPAQIIPIGTSVTISGVTPPGYNGTWVVTVSSAGSVSFASAATGAQTVAGSIYFGGGYGSGVVAPSGTGTPITATDWTLDNWGEVFLACPLNGPIYTWSPSDNTPVSTIIANAPIANSGVVVAMPQRQIIAWGSTFNGVQDALLVRWCDVNNYDVWAPQVTNQAGSFRIPKGSKVVQCIQGPQQTLVWTDVAVWSMQYVGPPYVYQINEIGTGCGLIGRKAATSIGGVVYWMGQSQFFRLSGNGVEPIRCPIWDVIFQDLDTNNLAKIRVAPNSRFGEISWYYPTNSNNGEISQYVKYNIILDQWDFGELARTAWINESVLGPPIGASPNYNIYQHETSPDADGMAMNSSFQTGYFAMTEADVKIFVDQIWPDMKWGYYGSAQNAQVSITFYVADYPGQTPLTYGPFNMTQASTFITPRFRGRLVSIKVESNDIGSWWRIGNIRYRLQQDGRF